MGARLAMMRLRENQSFPFGPDFTLGHMSRERRVPATMRLDGGKALLCQECDHSR
jgi:hypothetical protein